MPAAAEWMDASGLRLDALCATFDAGDVSPHADTGCIDTNVVCIHATVRPTIANRPPSDALARCMSALARCGAAMIDRRKAMRRLARSSLEPVMHFEPLQQWRAKGPQTSQPRATPWVLRRFEPALKGRRTDVQPLQGLISLTVTQGVALGWLVDAPSALLSVVKESA